MRRWLTYATAARIARCATPTRTQPLRANASTPSAWRAIRPDSSQAPAEALVTVAARLAKGLVRAVESGGLRPQRASALDPSNSAGRAIGNELRRRRL